MKEKIKNNEYRKEVVNYLLEKSKFSLGKFKIEEYPDYPGAIALTDKLNRKIIVYYDYLTMKIQVVYEGLFANEDEAFFNLFETIFPICYSEAKRLNQEVCKEVIDKKYITIYRKSIETKEIIKKSCTFDINNEFYDLYEYMLDEMSYLTKENKEFYENDPEYQIFHEKFVKILEKINARFQ